MPETTPNATPERPVVRRKKAAYLPFVVIALAGAIGFFVLSSSTSGGAGVYNFTLEELGRDMARVEGKELKVVGQVQAGSVSGDAASRNVSFRIEDDKGHTLAVHYARLLPDPFQEGREVILQGRLTGGVFEATNMTVKCPSRYQDEGMSAAEQDKYWKEGYKKHEKTAGGAR